MIRLSTVIAVYLMMTLTAFGQSSKVDSLRAFLIRDLADSVRVDILLQLSEQNVLTMEERQEYASTARDIAVANDYLEREAYALKWLGLTSERTGAYVDAITYYEESLELFRTVNNLDGVSNILNNLGSIYNAQGNDTKGLEYFLESLQAAEIIDSDLRKATAMLNVGSVYMKKTNTYDQAIDHLRRSIPIAEGINYDQAIAIASINLGEIFIEKEEADSALQYFGRARDILEGISAPYYSHTLNLIGKAYILKGDFASAIQTQEQAIRYAENKNLKLELANSVEGLADSYKANNQPQLARQSYLRAEALYKELGAKDGLKEVYEGLAYTYEELADFRNAFRYHTLFSDYKDSLYNIATADELRTIRFTHELEQKESEIQLLNQENELKEAQIQKAQVMRNFLFATAGFILIILAGVVVQYRLKKRAEEKEAALAQERELNEELQKIDKMKDQFLANTSHELRTPLNGIIGLAESLRDGAAGVLPEKAIYNLDMIRSSGKRLANLVNDILDFSKLKSHDIELQLKPLDMHAVVDLVLQLSVPLLGEKNVRLLNSIPRDVPLVEADENRIQQILHNLVDNAIKFTHEGDIEVTSALQDDMLALTVTDSGIGIPEDKFEDIFKSFEQGDGDTAREYGGTGLGLAVTKQLVELHGGEIIVTSRIGEGASFTITLPLSEEERKEASASSFVHKAPSANIPTVKQDNGQEEHSEVPGSEEEVLPMAPVTLSGEMIEVLVVDDEPVNRQVLENHLSLAGYSVTQAANGPEALKIIRESQKKFDMVLLDIMMPRMSGYEVCVELRTRYMPSELPIVMLTAKNQVDDLVQGFSVGANDYLTKPFMKDELLSRIKTHLNLHRINRATGKFVPMQFLRVLGRETITDVRLGDNNEKEVTVFFSDIRSYTTLSEGMTPEENFRFVNAYNRRMGPIIEGNDGFINQYLGDGIMAIFPDQAQAAMKAAVEMQVKIQEYNVKRMGDGRLPIKVGMGMHTGQLIMGITGDGTRMDATTVSDAVNTASRIEGLTKHFGAKILISDFTKSKLTDPDLFNFRYLGQVLVKGKEKPLGIFECFDGDTPEMVDKKLATMEVFSDGLSLYLNREFTKSIQAFNYVLKENSDDGTAQRFLKKATICLEEGIPDDWTGVETMANK